ncbi:MAG: glycosyltransferase family 8 protein, partial [Hungatella sp.]
MIGRKDDGMMEDKRSDTAHIVYASDNHFVEILGVSLVSLYENSQDMEDIIIYILDSGIMEENKQKIETICLNYRRKLPQWIRAKNINEELSMGVEADRGSWSQYARLFISSVLPEHLQRVMSLDCDLLIMRSIKEFWELDMHGKTIAALMDAFSKSYRVNLGLQPDDIMFNAGVMLIDLPQWKEKKVEEKLLSYIAGKKGRVQQADQGALNAILSRDIKCIEPYFNSVTILYDFSYEEMQVYRKPPQFYTREQVKRAVEEPRIIHFTTSFLSRRPWMEGCRHRYVGEWLRFKAISPWKDEPLWR